MVTHRVAGAPLDFAALRAELAVPGDFASPVLADARAAAAKVELPDDDATDIPFVTIDPPGSRDLDQAVHIARDGPGYLVSYAIADVASFVSPGSATDDEAHRRGETLYFPDARVPLHPPVLSEGAASLLPDQVRPAVLWRITLDAAGEPTHVDVRRARVRSTAQLDYAGAQQQVARGEAPVAISLLDAVGRLRLARARARHAINLDLPEQQVERHDGTWRLVVREPLAIEDCNAEISLLTGMCAARLMLDHGCGILRTLPEPDERAVRAIRRAARTLGVDWPDGADPGDVLASLDRSDPRHVALIEHAAALLRGAAYTSFDGVAPELSVHAGIGAPYTHATAPLRRLVDRYSSEICLALHVGGDIPAWVRERLPELPGVMSTADRRAHEIDRAVVDATEAWLLHGRVGDVFEALVIDANERSATVMLDDPPVRARCEGAQLPVGVRIGVRLLEADVARRSVRFERAEPSIS